MELKNKVGSQPSTGNDLETEIKYLKYDVIALKRLVKELYQVNEQLGVQVEAGAYKGMFKFYFFNGKGEELEHYNYFARSTSNKKAEEVKVVEEPIQEAKVVEEVNKLDDEALTDYIIQQALAKKKALK